MPLLTVLKTIFVHRDGKSHRPPIGQPFDFSDAEHDDIKRLAPTAVRAPVNELQGAQDANSLAVLKQREAQDAEDARKAQEAADAQAALDAKDAQAKSDAAADQAAKDALAGKPKVDEEL
jgi:hypothetical protein